MKRRFKLLASIASLTAAVALLVVGVLAATPRTFSVDGTVSFEASNIAATVVVSERHGTDEWAVVKTLVYTVDGMVTVDGGAPEAQLTLTFEDLLTGTLSDTVLTYEYKIDVTNNFTAGGSDILFTFVDSYVSQDWISTTGSSAPVTPVEPTLTSTALFSYVANPNLAPQSGDFVIGAAVSLERA